MELGLWSPRQPPFSSVPKSVLSPLPSPESSLSCSLNPIRLQIRFSCSDSGMLPKAKKVISDPSLCSMSGHRAAVSKRTGAKHWRSGLGRVPILFPKETPHLLQSFVLRAPCS